MASLIREKSREDILREKIPTRADVPTLYEPEKNMLMVVPLPEQGAVGDIVLPDRSRITYNEGHIVACGPAANPRFKIGDCVTWNTHSEYRMGIETAKFVLIADGEILMRIPKDKLVQACPEGESTELKWKLQPHKFFRAFESNLCECGQIKESHIHI